MKIYLASRYSRRLELCRYRDELRAGGHQVTSRWLNGGHQIDNDGRAIGDEGEAAVERGEALAAKFAEDDLADIDEAELFIAFTEQPRQGGGRNRGGRHVELGYAIAAERWGPGLGIWIVGPRENVFCWVPEISEQFDAWDAALAHLVQDEVSEVGGEG
jgi:hypothetical protein